MSVERAPQSVIDIAIKNLDYWSQHKHGSDELQRDLKYAAGVLRNLSAQPPPSQEGVEDAEEQDKSRHRDLEPSSSPDPIREALEKMQRRMRNWTLDEVGDAVLRNDDLSVSLTEAILAVVEFATALSLHRGK